MPVGVFLLKQFMEQIPRDLSEAAVIDGANKWQIYRHIALPLVKPALATVAISLPGSPGTKQTSALFVVDEAIKTLPYYSRL